MCKELPDHEIMADAIEDVQDELYIWEPTQEEIDQMHTYWQNAMRGCYE